MRGTASLPAPASPVAPAGGTSGTLVDSALSPAALLRAARKNWLIVVIALIVGLAGAKLYTASQTPIYEAVATVQLDPQPLTPLGNHSSPVLEGPDSYWSHREYFSTQREIIMSRKVASLVVRRLGLDKDGAFLGNLPPGMKAPGARATVEQAAEALRARLNVRLVEQSRLAAISVVDADPERAQRVVSAVVDLYVEQNLDSALDSAGKTAEWLDTQLVKLKADLESQEMELHDFKKSNNLLSVSYDDQSNMLRAQIQQLNTALTELKAKREHVAAKLSVLEAVDPQDPAEIPHSELFASTALGPLRENYLSSKTKLAQLLVRGKGDQHPEVVGARAEVEATRGALLGEVKSIRAGAASELAAVQRELSGVSTLYETAKNQALELNINELRYTRLRRSKDNTERTFGMLLERSTESGLSKLMPFNNVRVLDRPLKPGGPVWPRPLQNLALGAVLGLLFGLLGAAGRELLDRTVRSADEVEQELGVPSLGALPDSSAKSGSGYGAYYGVYGSGEQRRRKEAAKPRAESEDDPGELFVHRHPKSAVAEAARGIRTNLLFMSPDRPFKTVLVTSAGPSEGKTTVATSLAIAVAQTGRRVCLIDCDLRRPRMHHLFKREGAAGVTTVLLDPERLDEAAVESEVPNLWVVPSGPLPPNPADLVHSDAFRRLVETLSAKFDQVIIDSPPVCVVTDAVVISTRVDAAVLVVRAKKTRRDSTRKALRMLRDVGAPCVGFVFNATSESGSGYRQYSYYRSATPGDEPAERPA